MNVLSGMPTSNLTDGFFDYSADVVFFDYTCSWIAPRFAGVEDVNGTIIDSLWAIDDSGTVLTVDLLSTLIGNVIAFKTSLRYVTSSFTGLSITYLASNNLQDSGH